MADDKDKEVTGLVLEILDIRKNSIARQMLERIWYRNILYNAGEQWIAWYKETGTFGKRFRSKLVPTPIANKIRDAIKSEKALILNKNYVPRIWANSQEPSDIDAARIGEMLITDMDLSNDEEFAEEKERVIDWLLHCGTSFMRVFPDMSRGAYGIDANGEIIKSGEVVAEAVSPFNTIIDPYGDTFRKKRYVGVYTYKDREWVEDSFKVKIAAATSRDNLDYTQTLMEFVGNASPWKAIGINSKPFNDDRKDVVEFVELEFKPTQEYPEGRYVVMSNNQLLLRSDKLPLPVDKKKNEWLYSLTDFHYNRIVGRYWSDAFVNDLISPQDAINNIDQALIMNRRSIGRPRVIMPGDVKFKRINEAGQSFIGLSYDARLTGGVAPKFENGIPLSKQVLDERAINETTMQDTSGDPKNVLKGQIPTAGASGALVDILQETAEASHGPDIMRFYRALNRVYRKRLILASKLYTEKRIIKVVGPNEDLAVKTFRASDLKNNTDIRLELASGIFKTKASEGNALIQLMQTGMLKLDSITQRKVMVKLGFSDLAIDRPNVHLKRAEKEQAQVAAGDVSQIFTIELGEGEPMTMDSPVAIQDPLFKFDDHMIHHEAHVRFILSDEFKLLIEENRVIFMAHAETHKKFMELDMQKIQGEMAANQAAMDQTGQPQEQPAQGPEMAPEAMEGLEAPPA